MSWVAVAIGGSALIGAGAGIYSANKASNAQSQAGQQALEYQKQADARNQANIQPFLNAGNEATARLGQSYADPGSFANTPDYQFGFGQGASALQNSAAARGGLLGGNFARGITQFGQDYANNYLTKYRSGLTDIARLGAGAATGGGALANQSAGQVGQSYGNIGQAQASGYVGGANALTGSLGSGAQNYMLYNALGKSSYGGGSGGSPSPYNPAWNGNGSVGSPY